MAVPSAAHSMTNTVPGNGDGAIPTANGKVNGIASTNGHHASEIAELTETIASNTTIVNEYLEANKLPQPSFDEDGPVNFQLSPEVEKARLAALDASTQLSDLLRGPVECLRPTVSSISNASKF